jgi:hypothetical protein
MKCRSSHARGLVLCRAGFSVEASMLSAASRSKAKHSRASSSVILISVLASTSASNSSPGRVDITDRGVAASISAWSIDRTIGRSSCHSRQHLISSTVASTAITEYTRVQAAHPGDAGADVSA